MSGLYNYKGKILEVLDGDTIEILFDLGFKIFFKEKVRLYGINTPEIHTKDLQEKKQGFRVKRFLEKLLKNAEIVIKVYKQEKYGRYLADIILNNGQIVNALLIEKGMAKEYFGGKR